MLSRTLILKPSLVQPLLEHLKRLVRTIAVKVVFFSGAVRQLIKKADYYQLYRPQNDESVKFPFVKKALSRPVQILLYHRVNDEGDAFFPGVRVGDFRRQMEYLAESYYVCNLREAVERIAANDVPEGTLVVTFDDGYRDNFTNAFPILRELRLPATIFLASDAIGSGKPLWHDVVFSAFRATRMDFLMGFQDDGSVYPLKNLPQKLITQRLVLEHLWTLDDERRTFAIERLRRCLGVCEDPEKELMLSWDEIRVMHGEGISFGSHSSTHPILAKQPLDKLLREIVDSKRSIEEQLHCEVDAFAYPVGRPQDFDDRTKSLLKDTGYRCALTTRFGVNRANQDLFELRRVTPWEADLPSFAVKLAWYRFACSS